MQRFSELFRELDETNRTVEKVAALERYFRDAPPRDAAWALYFLIGRKVERAINSRLLREWAAEASGIPLWLVEESIDSVGDVAETLALLLPDPQQVTPIPFHQLIEERLVPLKTAPEDEKKRIVQQTWRELDCRQRLLWHKLITGEWRVGVARTLVSRAFAAVARVEPPIMAHRLMGNWQPREADFQRLLEPEAHADDLSRPYPFCLAYALEREVEALGEVREWLIEWKWDGIRSQLIRRAGEWLLWSRGEELMTDRFPDLAPLGEALPDGTVLDGEVMAWESGRPLPFAQLQTRIGRKKLTPKILQEVPIAFVAYDLLEWQGEDARSQPLSARRQMMESLIEGLGDGLPVQVSRAIVADDWVEVRRLQSSARERSVEGLMLKRLDSVYGVGRQKGPWWKWKIDPYTIDAVLIYAQRGHGRRSSLYTDYTFALWKEGQLVPVAKAYSGLTDEEIRQVDAFVRRNTLERFGPVHVVKPELVFELAFEGIQVSKRHKAGLAVRFPRMARWRHDKKAAEADTLETLEAMARQPLSKPDGEM